MKRLIFIFLGLILLFVLIFFIWHNSKENVILKQALQQQEQMIKQKEEQIQRLQEQLEALQKEQVLRERRIVILKKQKEQIQKPKSVEEILKAFKELGYDAVIK
jgi:ABC-type dipeptide/oligopeptide/nickel transport system permease component